MEAQKNRSLSGDFAFFALLTAHPVKRQSKCLDRAGA